MCAGTAQTRVFRCDTFSAGLVSDRRSPFRILPGLLGPACGDRPQRIVMFSNVVPRSALDEAESADAVVVAVADVEPVVG